jgi:hypothetical protein
MQEERDYPAGAMMMLWILSCGLGLQAHGPKGFDLQSTVNQVHMKAYIRI